MKRIIILCDGTWQAAEALHPTNVVRLGQALAPTGADGIVQVPIYIGGVGTGQRCLTNVSRAMNRALGGLFGLGLIENVVEAYRHLVFLHEPGDEVYLFGFSRGAFTARSLAGFIRFTGLLSRGRLARLPEAVARYAERKDETPEHRQARNAEWRARFAPGYLVDPKDAETYARFGADRAVPFDIAYMGVWDTVGALGIPHHLTAAPFFNRRFAFHDTSLSPMVNAARHAVALDECRRSYMPTLWSNLDALNEGRLGRPYRQAYFPGDHGAVGGGGDLTGLSALSLAWIIEGGEVMGLEFDDLVKAAVRKEGDPLAPLLSSSKGQGGPVASVLRRFGGPRDFVARLADVSLSARIRWAFDAGTGHDPYRPVPLAPLAAELARWRDRRPRRRPVT